MTYQRIIMRERETGYERTEDIRGETVEAAIEEAWELYPDCEDFHAEDQMRKEKNENETVYKCRTL